MKVVLDRRSTFSGTTVRVLDRRDDADFEDPEHPWVTECVDHAEQANWRTRREARSYAVSPPDWCEGCDDAYVRAEEAVEEQEREAEIRSDVAAFSITTTRLSCGHTFGPSDVVKTLEAIDVGLFRVCPKCRRAELVERIVREYVFPEERVDVQEALRENRRPKLDRPARIDRRLHGDPA